MIVFVFALPSYVGYPGKLFLNMLKCLILPLVVPSLIASIGSLDLRLSSKVSILYILSISWLTDIHHKLGNGPIPNQPMPIIPDSPLV